jgi:hypothetical protein
VRTLRWVLSRSDGRSHLFDDTGFVARCGHDIAVDTEPALHIVLCTQCVALLVREMLHALEVTETEAREWLALGS